jgi:hypothetical protein
MKGGSKEFWFVLTAESLAWFKDEEVNIFIVLFYIFIYFINKIKLFKYLKIVERIGLLKKSHC